jgi:hypothetical protein
LPQLAEQSSSVVVSQPEAQHPSPLTQVVIGLEAQAALHAATEPVC